MKNVYYIIDKKGGDMEKLHVKTKLNVHNVITGSNSVLVLDDTYNGSKAISEILFLTVNRSYNTVIDMRIKRLNHES